MSKLLVEELIHDQVLVHEFSYGLSQRVQLGGFYPYIFMKGAPAGDFYVTFRNLDGSFSFQKHFTASDIKAVMNTTDNNVRIFLPCIPPTPIYLKKGDYQMYLEAENYIFNRGAFIGWIKQHENLNNALNYTPSNDVENPLAFRLKVFKEGIQ